MKTGTFLFEDKKSNKLEYVVSGDGERVLFCFPGFGETADAYEFLSDSLEGYIVIVIHPYFVGRSEKVNPTVELSVEEWLDTFQQLISYLSISDFSVLGFSIGGRFATVTFQYFGQRINHLILVAPDAIQLNWVYQLATFPIIMRQIFAFLMKFPFLLLALINLLSSLGCMNTALSKFVSKHIGSPEARQMLYNSWIVFKPIRVKQALLTDLLRKAVCHRLIVFGEKDRVIKPQKHLLFLSKLKTTLIHISPMGHSRLVKNSMKEIKTFLSDFHR